MQRTKGRQGEQEIVNLLKEQGIAAQRISMMETGGIDKGDIRIGKEEVGQVKRGQHVSKFLTKAMENADYLFTRRDREGWLVTMKLDTFLSLYTLAHLTY